MTMMSKSVVLGAALCVPGAAFVPQGSLRGQTGVVIPQEVEVSLPELAAPAVGSSAGSRAAVGTFGVSVVGLAAAALVKAARKPQRASRVECRVVGVCEPVMTKFDPLNLADTDAKMERYTAAEVKHGRIAMLATMGYFLPDIFRYPGCEGYKHGLAAFTSLPIEGWVQILLLISAHEALVKPRAGGLGGFDFGLGTELIDGQPAEEVERVQTSERNNGRLAMVAIMGLIVQDAQFGLPPLEYMKLNGFWGTSVDWFVKDIGICYPDGAMCATRPRAAAVKRTALRAAPKMSPAVPYVPYPEALEGWVGEEKGFDPLGFSDSIPVYYLRESEIKHGRVCMLATVGWIATDLGFRFQGELFQSVQTTFEAHDKMVKAGVFTWMEATCGLLELYAFYLGVEGFAGNIKREPGEFFLGKQFLPSDPAGKKLMQAKEIENGRLAMLAFSGIWAQAALTGKPWPFL